MTTVTATPVEPLDNPAKFSAPILKRIAEYLDDLDPARWWHILDPFAGVGNVHRLAAGGRVTVASELELPWAMQGAPMALVADALRLPFRDRSFDAVVTSPVYGNRLSDVYDGKGVCRKCRGSGTAGMFAPDTPCPRCGGAGHDTSRRLTYMTYLGRRPSSGSAATLQWGPEYRRFHRAAWVEVARVAPVLILNVSDHYRDKTLQPVVKWHHDELVRQGWWLVDGEMVDTARYGNGANRDTRAEAEAVMVFTRIA